MAIPFRKTLPSLTLCSALACANSQAPLPAAPTEQTTFGVESAPVSRPPSPEADDTGPASAPLEAEPSGLVLQGMGAGGGGLGSRENSSPYASVPSRRAEPKAVERELALPLSDARGMAKSGRSSLGGVAHPGTLVSPGLRRAMPALSAADVLRADLPASPPKAQDIPMDQGGTFVDSGVNELTDTREDRFSTFAIDVDTASYTYARRFLEQRQRPRADSVRVEEWVNAFHYDYEGPEGDEPFAIHLAAAPSPLATGRHLMQVGIQGKRLSRAQRKPVHLTFLVDVSGSMSAPDKLPMAQRALHLLTNELDERDSVSIVTYAGHTGEVLPATKVTSRGRAQIHAAIDELTSSGGTHMSSGMELAYRNAHRFLSSETNSRVIVLSDGDANIGRTSHEDMLHQIRGYVSEGVTLSTVGFGTGNYRDHLMEQLADAGNGNYSYIDSDKAARKVFVDDLTGTLEVIAKDVKIQVEFHPEQVASYRLIGYENRDVADQDFRNDRVDAGEIGAGHTVTALYEVVLRDGDRVTEGDLATVRVRHKAPRGERALETTRQLRASELHHDFTALSANARFATAAALGAELLRGSPYVAHLDLSRAIAMAEEAAVGQFREERLELARLLRGVSEERPAYSWR
ncbi:MAG: vWA domain-containing protein [Myxococcota bacterium]